MKKYDYLVVGSGLYGAVFAHEARKAGKSVLVIDKRPNIAGNVYTEEIEKIHVHKYGAHIFHTNNKKVWNYITQFAEFNRFTNSPVANYKGELYSLPFNMYTFNKMWGVVTPEEAEAKIEEQKKEAGIKADVIEDGMTFEENAMIKATEIAKIAHEMPEYAHAVVLADDSGLEIDYLNKEPGIYSARYMGEDTSYDIKNQALLDRLDGVPDEKRTARFVCAIAAAMPDGCCEVVRGTMEGIIGHKIAGENGFGYDPIFFLPECGCTSAELSPEKKNELSHRGEGLKKIRKILEQR